MLMKLVLASSLAVGVLAQKHHHHGSSAPASSAASAHAPQVSAQTSINLFLGPQGDSSVEWEASIIGITDCQTTLGLTCTVGKCKQQGGISATVTEGNNVYQFSTSTALKGVTQVVSEQCTLDGFTAAACTVSIDATSGTSTKTTSTTGDFRGSEVKFAKVPVTAGASLLSSAASTCSAAITGASGSPASSGAASHHSKHKQSAHHSKQSSPHSSSGLPSATNQSTSSGSSGQSTSSSSGGVAAPTSLSSVYKILVVPAAALLALA